MTWCPTRLGLPYWSIRLMPRPPRQRYATYRTPRAASGCKTQVLNASSGHEIEAAFATLVSRRVQFATLAARYGIPTAHAVREDVEAGGLMSYGTDAPAVTVVTAVTVGDTLAPCISPSRALSAPQRVGRPVMSVAQRPTLN
jgi:hypothetical protein